MRRSFAWTMVLLAGCCHVVHANDLPLAPSGFAVEQVYQVPRHQGSWVSLVVEPGGALLASDQFGDLYRLNLSSDSASSPQATRVATSVGCAQGMCFVGNDLYVVINGQYSDNKSGLYRLRDVDGDGSYREVVRLAEFAGSGEHGPHAVVPTADGKSLYVCGGNHVAPPGFDHSLVPQVWDEDLLLPRFWDPRGHARGIRAPGGWVSRYDLAEQSWTLLSIGFRNQYDLALNGEGELFTFDADMEWDIGTPWYRPTRILQVVPGADFGWRSGSGKWHTYYPDTLPPVVEVGPGSPTGLVFGKGTSFPEAMQLLQFAGDWSYGVIYAVRLDQRGATYQGDARPFITGTPLPVTDLVVHPQDGCLYFAVGGRKTESAVYRVRYTGEGLTEQWREFSRSRRVKELSEHDDELLRSLPSLEADTSLVEEVGEAMLAQDRTLRYIARATLERSQPENIPDLLDSGDPPATQIDLLLAWARTGDREALADWHERALMLDWKKLSDADRLGLLRSLAVVTVRWGQPPEPDRNRWVARLRPELPVADRYVAREIARLLAGWQVGEAIDPILTRMESAASSAEQIHYAVCLAAMQEGWSLPQRRRQLAWFHQALGSRGGMSLEGYLLAIRRAAIESFSDDHRTHLRAEIEHIPQRPAGPPVAKDRPIVKQWFVEELLPELQGMRRGRSFDKGKAMFAAASCNQCHRIAGEGDTIGPDLTTVAKRFSHRDLLTAIIKPDDNISDQYRQTQFVANGKMITGRVVNLSGDTIMVNRNMLDASDVVSIKRSEIEERSPSPVSMMPSGTLDTLNKAEVLDLMAYLLSGGDSQHPFFRPQRSLPVDSGEE